MPFIISNNPNPKEATSGDEVVEDVKDISFNQSSKPKDAIITKKDGDVCGELLDKLNSKKTKKPKMNVTKSTYHCETTKLSRDHNIYSYALLFLFIKLILEK